MSFPNLRHGGGGGRAGTPPPLVEGARGPRVCPAEQRRGRPTPRGSAVGGGDRAAHSPPVVPARQRGDAPPWRRRPCAISGTPRARDGSARGRRALGRRPAPPGPGGKPRPPGPCPRPGGAGRARARARGGRGLERAGGRDGVPRGRVRVASRARGGRASRTASPGLRRSVAATIRSWSAYASLQRSSSGLGMPITGSSSPSANRLLRATSACSMLPSI